jgi:hypothetical protein
MARMITLNCPSCGAKARISDDSSRLFCDHCGNEHLMQMKFIPVPVEQQVAQAIRPILSVPNSVRIEQDESSWRIIQSWFSWKYLPMALFAVVWCGFLVFWYGIAFRSGELMMLLFPLAHVAAGVFITYTTLAGFLNRTTIELYQGELMIRFDPLPWPGEKKLPAREIKQLFCKEHLRRSKNGSTMVYHLYAVTQNDRQVKLLSSLESPDTALFLEQQLEEWLRITDQPVVGEMRR